MTQPSLVLYHYWRSSASWRVRWGLACKGLRFESRPVNLLKDEQKAPEFLRLNPMGFLPCLLIDGVPFGESLAILEFLEEHFPGKALLPKGAVDRLKVRQLALTIAAGTAPLQNLSPQRLHSDDPEKRKAWCQHWIHRGLSAYETLLAADAKLFSYGGALSLADLCLIPQVYNALRYDIKMETYPKIKQIYEHCLTTPECQMASPQNQPEAVQ